MKCIRLVRYYALFSCQPNKRLTQANGQCCWEFPAVEQWITPLFYYKYHVMNTSSSLFADLLRELSLAFANDQKVFFRTVHRSRVRVKSGCADLRMSQQIGLHWVKMHIATATTDCFRSYWNR